MSRDPTIAGTTVKFLADKPDYPIVIVKDARVRCSKNENKYRFALAFDTSDKSKSALRQILKMMRPEDHLTIVTVKENAIKLDTIEASVSAICAEFNYSKQVIKILEKSASETVYKCIKNFLVAEGKDSKSYIDFVGVGNNGVNYMKNKGTTLGSVADMIIRAPRMNVIFCPK